MGEDARVIAQLIKRADDLIAEADRVFARLSAARPGIDAAREQCAAAARMYAVAHAREDEQAVLMELAARVGRRQVIFAQRSEVAQHQANSERELHEINRELFVVQLAVGAGKLAEATLAVYAWAAQSGKVLATIETEIQAARGGVTEAAGAALRNASAVRDRIDNARNIVDASKTILPGAAGVMSGLDGRPVSWSDVGTGVAQLLAMLVRVKTQFRASGKTLWDTIGMIKRARKADDISGFVSAVLHELKLCVDVLKNLIDVVEAGQREVDRSGMASFAAGLGTALSVLRDLWDAGVAFLGAYRSHQEMAENLRRLAGFTDASARFNGSEEEALARLPVLSLVRREDIESIALRTTDYNSARVLVDAARRESSRIQQDAQAAVQMQQQQSRVLWQALRECTGDLDEMEDLLTRIRYQLLDLGFVQAQGGVRGSAARTIKARLEARQARYLGPVTELQGLRAAAGR